MNKILSMLAAAVFMLNSVAVPTFAEGTETEYDEYGVEVETVDEETEICDDEIIAAKPNITEREPEKPKSETPVKPPVTAPEKEETEPKPIPEDEPYEPFGEWDLNLDGFDLGNLSDLMSGIPLDGLFDGFMSGLEAEPETGEPFEEEGNAYTRDLLYDKDCHKQFITVQTRSGNTFYIVIDYDSPVNAEEEQYQVYFLNMVDDADLLSLLDEETATALSTCNCTDKCVLGKVKVDCPVCKNDLTVCKGTEPEPQETEEPSVEETHAEEKEQSKPSKKNNMLPIIGVIGVVAVGGLAFYYFKFIKGKKKNDMDFYDDEGYEEHYVNEDEPDEDSSRA